MTERMIGLRSYQDIKTPDEIDIENRAESIFNSLMQDYDYEMGSYKSYEQWARREARKIAESEYEEVEE